MNCSYHPDRPAVTQCPNVRKGYVQNVPGIMLIQYAWNVERRNGSRSF